MKQFSRVLSFSFTSMIRSKGMIISTIVMCVIIAAGISIPSLINFFSSVGTPEPSPSAQPGETPQPVPSEPPSENRVIVVDPQETLFSDTAALAETFPDYDWKLVPSANEAELREQIENGDIHSALIIQDRMNATYLFKSDINVLGNNLADSLQTLLTDSYRYELLMTYNVSQEDAARFFVVPMLNSVNLGIQNMVGQIQSFVFILLLYIAILSSGQLVSTSVVQEKSSRAMEVLITTTRPETLMFGKVIGIGMAGLAQMLVFLLTGAGAYLLNQDSLVSYDLLAELFNIPASTFVYALLFFLGGYFLYAMLFAAIGSLVSRTEDLASANTPMTLFTVAGFLVAIYGQLYGFADSLFYKVCSYIPFTAPYVMLARICGETNIPVWEIWASIGALYLSTLLVGIISAKIYRIGVLIYGKRPSLKEVFRALRQA